jgi:hypothetical protein
MITLLKTVLAVHQPIRAITYLALTASETCSMVHSTGSDGGFSQMIIQNTTIVVFVVAASVALFSDELLPLPRTGKRKGDKMKIRTRIH